MPQADQPTVQRILPALCLSAVCACALSLGGCVGYDSNRGSYDVSVVSVSPEIVDADEPTLTSVPVIAGAENDR